ncbi:MAG: aldehyde dehydrogenase family protein, partial [Boseongicola sp. SB0675_bin_26]|nr:aldehyde dehydrogenase family protein [Boseongicola sp. SB0675_bin_26]
MTIVTQWINGEDVPGDGEALDIINPATGAAMGLLTEASPEQVSDAVAAARRSFDDGAWAHAPMPERRAVMRLVAEAIRDNVDELQDLQVAECGMVRRDVGRQMTTA